VLVLIEKRKDNQIVEYPLDLLISVTAEPGAVYTIEDTETGEPPEDLVLKKKGDTLEVEVDGETVARRIQLQVEYRPAPPFGDGHPDSAAPALVEAIRRGTSGYTARMAEVDARVLARLEQGDDPR